MTVRKILASLAIMASMAIPTQGSVEAYQTGCSSSTSQNRYANVYCSGGTTQYRVRNTCSNGSLVYGPNRVPGTFGSGAWCPVGTTLVSFQKQDLGY